MKNYKFINVLSALFVLFAASGCGSSSEKSHGQDEHGSEAGIHNEILLTEKQLNTVGIELGTFKTMSLGESVNCTGELAVDPQCVADVAPLMNGIIKNIYVREGDFIKAGTIVAGIETFEANNLVRDYKNALADLRLAESEYVRQKKLSENGAGIAKNLEKAKIEFETAKSIADSYISQLRMTGINLDKIEAGQISENVKSPISGIVTAIYGRIGSESGFSQPILTVTDNSGIYALIKLYEKDINKIKKGMPVEISLTNGSDNMRGEVEEIIRSIDPESKTIDVRVVIVDKEKDNLIPGMAVTAFINTDESETTVLPEEAVVSIEGKDFIYVLSKKESHDGQTLFAFRPLEVTKGNSRNGFVEVNTIEELPADTEIVVSKAFYLASMSSDHGEHNH